MAGDPYRRQITPDLALNEAAQMILTWGEGAFATTGPLARAAPPSVAQPPDLGPQSPNANQSQFYARAG